MHRSSAADRAAGTGRKRTLSRPRVRAALSRPARRLPSPMNRITMSRARLQQRRPRRCTTSRFCDSPMLPACSTTKRRSSPCARANSLSFADGTIADVSAQLWITVIFAGVRALAVDQARRHGVAERDDARRRAAPGSDSGARAASLMNGLLKVLEQPGDLREDVLAEEHHAAARPRRERRQADDRRIGQRDRHVLSRQPQRRSTAPTGNRSRSSSRARRTSAATTVVPRARMMRTPLRSLRRGNRTGGGRRIAGDHRDVDAVGR